MISIQLVYSWKYGGWKKSCTTSTTIHLPMHNLHPRTPKLNVEWPADRWCRISVTRTNPFWSLCLQTMLNWEREVSTVGLWKWCRISSINSIILCKLDQPLAWQIYLRLTTIPAQYCDEDMILSHFSPIHILSRCQHIYCMTVCANMRILHVPWLKFTDFHLFLA